MSKFELSDNSRHRKILSKLKTIIFDLSGSDLSEFDHSTTFLEIGFDSLFLIQMSTAIKGAFEVEISFRQLIEEIDTFEGLLKFLDAHIPEHNPQFNQTEMQEEVNTDEIAPLPLQEIRDSENAKVRSITKPKIPLQAHNDDMTALISQQLELMSHQLEVLRLHGNEIPQALQNHSRVGQPYLESSLPQSSSLPKIEQHNTRAPEAKPFGAIARITRGKTEDLSPVQQKWLEDFIHRYNERTVRSKEYAEQHRPHMADPRVVNGFKSKIKDLIYPLVVDRTERCRIWDLDGNEYVDALNGFGSNFFGYRHPKITQAVVEQLWRGAEIGPQNATVGPLARTICNLIGMERAAFCNTGSEAVMGAMRMARTVTGRSLIAIFNGSYHGIFDEVLVRGTKNLRSVPASPGILPSSVENVLVLDYGTDESLEILQSRAHELAAVMVEPIQSRRPEFRPREFLQTVRKITEESGSALIFDEVITGFRLGLGGAQQYYNIQADIATYGKVIGGGMPIGVMAGKARFMDALDGGAWSYGDASVPEVGVTYFAGTFVRHPAAMAACHAAIEILQDGGQSFYSRLSEQTTHLSTALNSYCKEVGAPLKVEWFSSLFRITTTEHVPYGELLFYLMRQRGVHIYDGFPCFLTLAHADEDVEQIIHACKESIRELQEVGLLPTSNKTIAENSSECCDELGNGAFNGATSEGTSTRIQKNNQESSELQSNGSRPIGEPFSLTEAQMEIWLAAQMSDMASCAYNEPFILSLRGALNLEILQIAIQEILSRHEALHLCFGANEPVQTLRFPEKFPIPFQDFSLFDAETRQAKIEEIVGNAGSTAFDLSAGPMVRIQLIRLQADDHRVIFSAHHIVCDGWSWNVMLREIGSVYSAEVQGSMFQLPPAGSYRDYVEKEMPRQDSAKTVAMYDYWMNEFKEFPAPLELPIDHARPRAKTYRGATVSHIFNSALYGALKKTAMRQKASLFSITFSLFNVLLARLTHQYDVVVTVPTAGQLLSKADSLVGHCVNLLPVRSRLDHEMSFQKFLSATTQKVLDAYENQNCTLGGIIKRLPLPRDASRLPLVEVNFNLDRDGAAMEFHGLQAAVEQTPKRAVNFDLFFNLNEMQGQLRIDLDYNSDLFDEETMKQWIAYYEVLMTEVIEDPRKHIGDLRILPVSEEQKILTEWNHLIQEDLPATGMHHLVEAQAAKTPNAVAVACQGEELKYEELNQRANQLAHALRKWGVVLGVTVGLFLERSPSLLIVILGILKSGGAYVPLPLEYPEERLDVILKDADISVVITEQALVGLSWPETIRVVNIDHDLARISQQSTANLSEKVLPEQLAYLIYTSGSTGAPKGVEITHGACVNFLHAMIEAPGIKASDRLLAVTPVSFDIAVLELLCPLTVGGQVHLARWEEAVDGRKLVELLNKSQATIMQATPATWQLILNSKWQGVAHLKMLCGGSMLSRELAEKMLEYGAELWNMYGPTETTIWSAVHRVVSGNDVVPIGRPILNTKMYVLDQKLQPVPIGVKGQLYIGGFGLAKGYRGRPELTKERFIQNPFSNEVDERIYNTGDLARFRSDGTLVCMGRKDSQVKVRGFRIELDEVEAVLAQYPKIRGVVVVTDTVDGEVSRLLAYVVIDSKKSNASLGKDLHRFLKKKLPEYMIPSAFIILENLPLTKNGKIDYRALPKPAQTSSGQIEIKAPQTPTEASLIEIWSAILGTKSIGIDDNFFELGGYSLSAAKMLNRVRDTFMSNLSLLTVFENPTIKEFAKVVDQEKLNDIDEQELLDLLDELEKT